jgi:DNA-binding NarL/FixJ family response regulator
VSINNLQTTAAIDSDTDFKRAALSDRELEVLSLYASGLTQKQVAFQLNIAQSTVKEHIDRVRKKYADVGRPITDKTDFLKRAIEDEVISDIE